jgi:YesN/AraC family two-component response regulator
MISVPVSESQMKQGRWISYSVYEITYLLGFSEPSVFHRFFKKLTGLTPVMYRDNLMT